MSSRSSFVEVDLSILSEKYDLVINTYNWRKKSLVPLYMVHQLWVLIKYSISAKSIIISSGGYWSILPVVFGKVFSIPVYIILNGSDCASLPFLNYGNLRNFLLRNVCRLSFEFAGTLLPVSESLVRTKNTYYSKEHPVYQGYKHFFPHIKTPYKVVFNGLDNGFWKNGDAVEKEKNSFISVFSSSQYILKGGDLIVEIARRFPDCKFYMAGLSQPPDNTLVSSNTFFLGHLKPWELRDLYNKCQFHFQLSIFEGFGCSLCEAMLCECIPIGSDVNIIPQIIEETGYILMQRDLDLLEGLINEALHCENKKERGENARKRVIENFSIDRREKQLLSIIE